MPTFAWLLSRAQKLTIHSEFPPITPTCWTSILTGVNPGKHGIFSFERVDVRKLRVKLYNAKDLMHPRIHEMLAMAGKKSVIINPIPEHPIVPAKGANIISHLFFSPRLQFYPERLRKYAKMLPDTSKLNEKGLKAVKNYYDIIKNYVDVIDEMINELEWDVFWININFPDFALHRVPQMFFKTLSIAVSYTHLTLPTN